MSEYQQINPFDLAKAKVSLEEYFAGYLKCDLRVGGANLLETRCPWHNEKTPSLKINIDENYFKCYGACDFGGSVIDAVMRQENYDYPNEALEWLNNHYKLGITANSDWYKDFKEKTQKAKKKFEAGLSEMNDPDSKIAKKAKEYLTERGYKDSTIEYFQLTPDKPRARLLVPIFEKGGHPSAWSGRSLYPKFKCSECGTINDAEDLFNQRANAISKLPLDKQQNMLEVMKEPSVLEAASKCINCHKKTIPAFIAGQFPKYKDSQGYNKNETLYNYPFALKELRQQKEFSEKQPILVMEGFADVWSCYQAGFKGAVAYNSSKMTINHASLIVDLATKLDRWVGIIPDLDPTGRSKIHGNIDLLRKVKPDLDIRILHGIDKFTKDDGTPCKDAGDITQYQSDEILHEILMKNWWSADEYKIRHIIEGDYDKLQQIERITDVLKTAQNTISLDSIVPLLSEKWESDEDTVRTFLHATSHEGNLTDSSALISNILEAKVAAAAYLKEGFVIPTDYDVINQSLPGGGFRLGQVSNVLGKCLDSEQLVSLADGSQETIKELYNKANNKNDEEIILIGIDKNNKLKPIKMTNIWNSGIKECYKVVLEDGSSCSMSADHRIKTLDGWIRLKDIMDDLPDKDEKFLYFGDQKLYTESNDEIILTKINEIIGLGQKETYDLSVDQEDDNLQAFIAGGLVVHNSGTGKSASLNSIIITPDGTKRMGDIRLGDKVINPEGGTTEVIGIFPQGKRQMYRLTFSDGTSTETDGEHIFYVKDSNKVWKHKTVNEIRRNINLSASPHFIPVTVPVEFNKQERLKIDPYLLGVILGDCSIASNTCVSFASHTDDFNEMYENIKHSLGDLNIKFTYRKTQIGDKIEGLFVRENSKLPNNNLIVKLRELNLIHTNSRTKFIPKEYLLASIDERLEIIKGLMDTDGSISYQSSKINRNPKNCYVEYCTISPQLAKDFVWLVQSLGGTANLRTNKSGYKNKDKEYIDCGVRYRISFNLPDGMNPFKLQRKAVKWKREIRPYRRIVSIEKANVEEAQCIMLDSDNHLYMMNDFICTHNTTFIANMLWQFLKNDGLPCIFFSLEQPKAQVYMMLAQVALGVTSKEIEDMIKNQDEKLKEVDEIFKNLTIIDNVPGANAASSSMTPGRVAQLIHEVNLTRGGEPVKVIAIDHLGIIKPDSSAPGGIKDSDSAAAGWSMEQFFTIAKQTKTFFLILQQLPKEVPPGEEFGYDAGRGSSQQTDFCDYIFCIWRPDQLKGLSEDEKTAYAGEYKLKLGKNRHGPNNVVAHLNFDHRKRRIVADSGVPDAFMPANSGFAASEDDNVGAPPELFGNDDEDEGLPDWVME